MYENIPKELKDMGKFCLYKLKEVNGRKTKVPFQIDGRMAKSNDEKSFSDFKTVASFTGYDGIGMYIGNGYSAIDIDHCVDDGIINDMALDIINLMNSYTEYSPSGTGIRIIFKIGNYDYDKSKYYINNQKRGLEVYVAGATNKYVSLTGNYICNPLIGERTNELNQLLEKYMLRDTQVIMSDNKQKSNNQLLNDDQVIEKAMQASNGDKFKNLWSGIIPSEKSQSEADLSLCLHLAFWTNSNAEQIDRLFRKSGLMRDKWNREDYRETTISKAISMTTETYKPSIINICKPDLQALLKEVTLLDPVHNSRYVNTDIGNGRLYADIFKPVARYVPQRKKWFIFDGKRWTSDVGSLKAMELCKNLADVLLYYSSSIADEKTRLDYLKECCGKWQNRHYREIYLKEAESVYPIEYSTFDSNKYLFNCNNGTLNLKTFEFYKHKSEDYITKISKTDYDQNAIYPRFNSFILEIMTTNGVVDNDKALFLQKVLGYGIGGSTKYECLFILYGETTRNGKGTLMESCVRVLGDYAAAVRPETITQKQFSNSSSPSEDIARLAGIRFANISEPKKGLLLDSAQVKSMTGNDTINARYLQENSFDYRPQFKLYINTNYLPQINDVTLFISNRIVVIPFNRNFEPSQQDKGLKEEFAKPEAQSAILNWLVKGYMEVQRNGLNAPQSVLDAIEDYSKESDKIAQFMDDKLSSDNSSEIKTSTAYSLYSDWCRQNGYYVESNRVFMQELRQKFREKIVRKRPNNGGDKTTLLLGYKIKQINVAVSGK